MRAFLLTLAIPAIAAVALPAIATATGGAIDSAALAGRFCGELWSGGLVVKAVTVLSVGAKGQLTGHYEFIDGDDITPGTLVERPNAGGLTRTFEWTDVYGTGRLVVTFDAGLQGFAGKWGMGDDEPSAVWNGDKRDCEGIVS